MAKAKKIVDIEVAIAEAVSNTVPEVETLTYLLEDLRDVHAKLRELGVNSIGDLENKIAVVSQAIAKL